jgi:hypothetical protein
MRDKMDIGAWACSQDKWGLPLAREHSRCSVEMFSDNSISSAAQFGIVGVSETALENQNIIRVLWLVR